MSWIAIAIIAYFFLALVNIGDKLFLSGFIPNAKVYTALIGILSMVLFVLAPWHLSWPGGELFGVSLLAGAFFVSALLLFFHALQVGEASRVIPFIGGLVPVFTLGFSYLFLPGSAFGLRETYAFVLLIIGTVLIVRMPHKTHWWDKIWERIHPPHKGKEIVIAVLSSACFAASFVGSKYVYDATPFLNGFLWIRLGSFLAVLFLLFNTETRRDFGKTLRDLKSKTGALFVGNQLFGAAGFFLQNVAISLGSVALVNALQGVQYVFVIVLAGLASLKFPKLADEGEISARVIVEKVLAIAIIGGGLAILAF